MPEYSVLFLDPSPALSAFMARRMTRRMVLALFERGERIDTAEKACAALADEGFPPEAIERIGGAALALLDRCARRYRRLAH